MPSEFAEWDQPGTVRIVFAHWIEQDDDGRAALVSESRVQPVDRRARLRMRALWTALGRFERLIGGEGLSAAAERAARLVTAGSSPSHVSRSGNRGRPSSGIVYQAGRVIDELVRRRPQAGVALDRSRGARRSGLGCQGSVVNTWPPQSGQ